MTVRTIEKVTAFITRSGPHGAELLLFEHPFAGIQFPAGTMEPGETPVAAVIREAAEETGLSDLQLLSHIASSEQELPHDTAAVWQPTKVFARPDASSFDWAFIRRGIWLQRTGRQQAGFVQVNYTEYDRYPDPQYVTMSITGWVPETALAGRAVRHYYHLTCGGDSDGRWPVQVDNHTFILHWAPLENMPEFLPPQDQWLRIFLTYWAGNRYRR